MRVADLLGYHRMPTVKVEFVMQEKCPCYPKRSPDGSPASVPRELGKARWVEEWRTGVVFLWVSSKNERRLDQIGRPKEDASAVRIYHRNQQASIVAPGTQKERDHE